MTILVTRGTSPWLTVPLGAFAAYWTYLSTKAVWHVMSFRIAVWRANLLPPISVKNPTEPPAAQKSLWWLANPKLDKAVDVATVVGVLVFPALLWLPLIFWLLD
ncbi:hypothetical protein [Bradyrhizobium sp. Ash2021]|uniref:hypothetical protein n=1 Tax=Bradyrhizobium sp. Ash2021 TaxID=2954771 RepID=UPI0028158853|nr:hypothetical protein [Bradyrhizobium sp. Ash2021]WMT71914.1 hypothetical protein NL528_28050 [Bradyrhizobium sp. Ash2021]